MCEKHCKRGCNTRTTHHTGKCIQIHVYFSNPSIYYANFCSLYMNFDVSIISYTNVCIGEQFQIFRFLIIIIEWQMAMLFRKTWRVNLYILCTFVCFIAFDSTLKWVGIWIFNKKNRILLLLECECDYKWQIGFSSTDQKKTRVMNASLSAFKSNLRFEHIRHVSI